MSLTKKVTALFVSLVGCASFSGLECRTVYTIDFLNTPVGEISACDADRNGEIDTLLTKGLYFSFQCPSGEYKRNERNSGCHLPEKIWQTAQGRYGKVQGLYKEVN